MAAIRPKQRRYSFHGLSVGAVSIEAWPDGIDKFRHRRRVAAAVADFGLRKSREFKTLSTSEGVSVERTA